MSLFDYGAFWESLNFFKLPLAVCFVLSLWLVIYAFFVYALLRFGNAAENGTCRSAQDGWETIRLLGFRASPILRMWHKHGKEISCSVGFLGTLWSLWMAHDKMSDMAALVAVAIATSIAGIICSLVTYAGEFLLDYCVAEDGLEQGTTVKR